MHRSSLQEMLPRWISLDEQTLVTQEAHLRIRHQFVSGRVDAVIGTHRADLRV
jgi:hypothetical protein